MICDMEIAKLEITLSPLCLPGPSDRSGSQCAQTGAGSVSRYMILGNLVTSYRCAASPARRDLIPYTVNLIL